MGIAEKDLKRIADPFFTTKEPNEGKGLGLYIAYNIIAHHQGTIDVNSVVGGGTEFIVTLPKKK